MPLKPGDLVCVVTLPVKLPNDAETKVAFERSVGRTFPIVSITVQGHVELEVGEVMGVAPYLHSIWIEPEHLELAQSAD